MMLPIHWAASDGKIGVLRYILSHRQDLNAVDSNGCSPIVIATQYNQVQVVVFLLESGADLSLRDNNGDTALHWAAYKGHNEMIALLAQRMPQEINSSDVFGQVNQHTSYLLLNPLRLLKSWTKLIFVIIILLPLHPPLGASAFGCIAWK